MTNGPSRPSIPRTHHPFMRIIRGLLRDNPYVSQEELKRRIINMRGLPPDMNDPFWSVRERSYRGEMRERRALFNDRFALALSKVQGRS